MIHSNPGLRAMAGTSRGPSSAPLQAVILIFWTAFAAAIATVHLSGSEIFTSYDPDSTLRLVQVRDLLAGQDWFDLVQHRIDPPAGVLMHWSRLIDAPLAGLVVLGNLISLDGESFALTFWPLLMLLGLMGGSAYAAVALGGPGPAVLALLMPLLFFQPLLHFLPGSIDHHNAQIALLMVTLASAMRLPQSPVSGAAAGVGSALMLAIGLETVVYVAVFGMTIAAAWALTGQSGRGTAYFGAAFGIAPAILYLLTGSPQAPTACDSISWTYALPAAVAGLGLSALASFGLPFGTRIRGLSVVAALAGASFLWIAPECRGGPYSLMSADFQHVIMGMVGEAQSIHRFFVSRPAEAIAFIAAPLIALAVSANRLWAAQGQDRYMWALPTLLIAAAAGLTFYQMRTAPYANALAFPVLSVWIADLAARRRNRPRIQRIGPVVTAFLLSMQVVHLGLGIAAVEILSFASGKRFSTLHDLRASGSAGLSPSERECVSPSASALLSSAPEGLVMAPLFYGSGVLALSPHSVVAAPYHRAESATLDTARAMIARPEDARRLVRARNVDYIVICRSAREVADLINKAPVGLAARLVAGDDVDWLDPPEVSSDTALKLYRVRN